MVALANIAMNNTNNPTNRMAKESTGSRLTGEKVLALLDEDEEDGMEGTFFPGSDNDFGLSSEDEGTVAGEDRWEY